jgi:hydroxyacylglutathione hydrolase
LLTHAHVDHVHDCAAILREHGCPFFYHRDGIPLLSDASAYRRYGLSIDFEPVTGGTLIGEGPRADFAGVVFDVLEVPGHCPGSLCFFDGPNGRLFAGDTLFAGSIGRADLPGGDQELLLRGIREKLLPLGDDVVVFSGHGPETTIGDERETNLFLS